MNDPSPSASFSPRAGGGAAKPAAPQSGAEVAPERRYLNATQAAAYLGVSVSWVRKATRRGRLPWFSIGARVLFDRADLDRWVEELKREAAWKRLGHG